MILLNSFYTVTELQQIEQQLHAVIHIDPQHEIFNGHFPKQPVVPGVCMIQIVKELMEQVTGQKLIFSKGHQIKFLHMIVPVKEEAIQVNISYREEENTYPLQADFKRNNEAAFKLSGLFRPLQDSVSAAPDQKPSE